MILVTLLAAIVLAVSYLCYWIAFYNPEYRHGEKVEHSKGHQYEKYLDRLNGLSSDLEQAPYEQVWISSHDGIRLAARYYHQGDNRPLMIQFHGYRGSGLRDLCGGCTLAMELGYNVLLVDQRAHGLSGGNTVSFGIKERYDCLSWIRYAAARFGKRCPIILFGVSMGASTVLMALGLELPEQVAGVIADSPFSSPGEIIQKVCQDLRLPAKLIYPFVVAGGLLFGRFRLWETDCMITISRTKLPVLLIHGEADRFVPVDMSERLCSGSPMASLERFADAGHVLSFVSDEARYRELIQNFVRKCIEQEY